jgi:hypothetical protein
MVPAAVGSRNINAQERSILAQARSILVRGLERSVLL